MDLIKHKQALSNCEAKAQYFKNIDFPNIAEAFSAAAISMKEMIEVLEKLNEVVPEGERGKDNG